MRGKRGRVSRERAARRAQWIAEHPPNHQGAWVCFWCYRWVYQDGPDPMELGHKDAKGGLTSDESEKDENLGPIHRSCNFKQGSEPYVEPRSIRDRGDEW